MAAKRKADHGTCWQECVCLPGGNCIYAEGCSDFTCEEGYRRKGDEEVCVKDECVQDVYHVEGRPGSGRLHKLRICFTMASFEDILLFPDP